MPIVLNRFFKFATIFILLITCTSCEIKESYTNKMWLKELALGAMIGDYKQETAYFKNVSENDETYVYIGEGASMSERCRLLHWIGKDTIVVQYENDTLKICTRRN